MFFRKKKQPKPSDPISIYVYETFGFYPTDIELFKQAFTHKSVENEVGHNERLEFLGDTILDSVIADYLFHLFPDLAEGELTKLKSRIVSREQLNRIGTELGVLQHIRYVKGNNQYKSLEGNVVEALIGAVYLDVEYSKTKEIILDKIIAEHIDLTKLKNTDTDYKSRVLIWAQKEKHKVKFELSQVNSKEVKYLAKMFVNGSEESQAIGPTKKEAEKEAARLYLKK